ncbi:hypothetical protein DPMN_002788 [Dreissena polymorpha]|uniref:Uncharacterized protein n=1 Tax=Dreissena polymorpha TaxID=45954 RepID=A0A9D4MJS7_DREPO|nr:hypothetical protein DPMN_002788 [Dreissena polymorpha]
MGITSKFQFRMGDRDTVVEYTTNLLSCLYGSDCTVVVIVTLTGWNNSPGPPSCLCGTAGIEIKSATGPVLTSNLLSCQVNNYKPSLVSHSLKNCGLSSKSLSAAKCVLPVISSTTFGFKPQENLDMSLPSLPN